MSRFVYVVTRIVKREPDGRQSIPILGVHGSRKRAERHYESVLEDRRKWGKVCELVPLDDERVPRIRHALSISQSGETEDVFIERWDVQRKEKA